MLIFFIENTNFTLVWPSSPDQPAAMQINFRNTNSKSTSVKFTISKCNFFNYNSTALAVDMQSATTVEEVYLNILDSKFLLPRMYDSMRAIGVAMIQGWGVQANVHTKFEGNTFGPSD